jgi:ribosomal protein S18 acetylase RimI-like enzyme
VLTTAWEELCAALPYGWAERADGALACVTTVSLPTLNGVWVDELALPAERVGQLLDRVAAAGFPYCLQLRPAADPALVELAQQRGMSREQDIPLMVLEEPARIQCAMPSGLVIHTLAPEQAHLHAGVAAAGFQTDEEHFRRLIAPDLLELAGVRCYLGEVAGEAAVSGLGLTTGEGIGVFNIATPPGRRRRGYGAAMTAQVIRDGLADGGRWAWLQSSPDGYSIYERLGFRTLESWQCWLAIP